MMHELISPESKDTLVDDYEAEDCQMFIDQKSVFVAHAAKIVFNISLQVSKNLELLTK